MKKKLSYWQKRYLKTKQLQLSKAEAYEKEYAKRLKETQKLIEQEIDSWCKKYAKKDGTIDPIDAKKLLKGSELKDFKYSLAEWERMAKQGGFNHEMDLEYYRSRVSRLQALQLQVTGLMGKQTSGDVKSLEGLLKGSYNDTYYRNIYNSQAVKGKFSSNFAHVDDKKLNAVIHSGWKGSNFSTRLWGNATHTLPKTLSETLFRGIALGYGPDRLTQMARVKLKDFAENQIHRLVTTEAAHIVEQATLDSYKEIGLEKYEYLATLESHTCEVCGKLDGQVIEVSKQDTGTNYPPIHPYCRCTTVPWDKWFEENDIKRWSRNEETGKGESIDDISYNKWKEDVFDKPKQTEDGIMKVTKYYTPKAVKGIENLSRTELLDIVRNDFGMEIKETSKTKLSDFALRETVRTVGMFKNIYDALPGKIPLLRVMPVSEAKNAIAHYSRFGTSAKLGTKSRPNEFAVNVKFFTNENYLTRQMAHMVKTKWLSNNSDTNHIMIHEFGHHVDFQLTNVLIDKGEQLQFSDRLFDLIKKENPKFDDVGVSDYAKSYYVMQKKRTEAFAEYFAEAYGSTPREDAQIFKKYFEQMIQEVLSDVR
ncbi:minor capsid protein [uncultured Lactococcus sp.]|uniref:minor capsid protein n=1 Tax=uncultured Lactococcus sp. TaxID=167973 RepID=UPI0027DB27B3|nr:minor capsid protein [uncultured Lactococcus sp.]